MLWIKTKGGGGVFYAPLKPVTVISRVRFKFRGKWRMYKIHYVPVRLDNYVFWLKYYPKKTADKIVYVKGVSGCAIYDNRLVFFPSVDADSRTPPKHLIRDALYYRKYISTEYRIKYHVILPHVDTPSQAIKLMRRYNDNHHLKVAIRTRMCPNWSVIRLTELPTETTLEQKVEYPYNVLLRLWMS